MERLLAISPIDGRYKNKTNELSKICSEFGLISYRVKVEIKYLIMLSEHAQIGVRLFSKEENFLLKELQNLTLEDANIVKELEETGYKEILATRHDVKSVEYFIKNKLKNSSLSDVSEWVHFGLTSEDINNISYALMIRDSLESVILPFIENIMNEISIFSKENRFISILARTHGQPASPTTFGKEFKVYLSRLQRQFEIIKKNQILVKLNGATGNYNAHYSAYPNVNWLKFSKDFVEVLNKNNFLKLELNSFTTQIEPQDSFIEIFDALRRVNTILIDFSQDLWRYISDGWLTQKIIIGEVGSSTMPHKVNPIDFENAEGNLSIANSMFTFFSQKLPISRLQRDLSNSTVQRNFGVAFSHCLISYKSLLKGLSKIAINYKKVSDELEKHPEVLTEAIQTVLRREGVKAPYEQLKKLSRGTGEIRLIDLHLFIDSLEISVNIKRELKCFLPSSYIGLAEHLTNLN
ncbi:MAG: adenylosuccinate lyase [Candidatus Magasanikbacteria bacterium]|nr:adenylosuccinate lyase [Candidatus Magasanikbacteria bacterium]